MDFFQFEVKLEMHNLHACAPAYTHARTRFFSIGWGQINKFNGSLLGVTGVFSIYTKDQNR